MELQRLGQRGMQGLHGWRAGCGGEGAECGQGRLRVVQALDQGPLSGADRRHSVCKVSALLLQVAHGPLQSCLAGGSKWHCEGGLAVSRRATD